MQELSTRCSNTCRIPADPSGSTFEQLTELTPLQARAFQLLGLSPENRTADSVLLQAPQ
jgi:hypothetical protein